ncbi:MULTISPECIES: trpE operon leader peptide TrpLE [Sinorhizobium]|uniref:TrpE operon leader peptide TrpLE n=1 Tax=Sinorhizobium chiapasense TaxID=501572 RepID=A0ABZ2BI84_9HYPH|nr:trpE operon leader peptide TrpLE [Sinorhizobium mexicanum]MCA1404797.1 trpE operon leader peptide TrpLE [Ensifer sp. BRP08]MCA1446840.1 trpE operon leader peptide TrpLE [Ensifer sp. IC3342]
MIDARNISIWWWAR